MEHSGPSSLGYPERPRLKQNKQNPQTKPRRKKKIRAETHTKQQGGREESAGWVREMFCSGRVFEAMLPGAPRQDGLVRNISGLNWV